jgi:IMP dehydrogenase/GMP reductase
MTVAVELARARDQFARKRYVYLVLDGSMSNVKDMTVALAFADFIMMGNYFNRFYEAAAQKLDADKLPVSEEALMRFVETWGEGHPKARLVAMYGLNYRQALMQPNVQGAGSVIERYGHTAVSSATVEGVAGTVPYRGRIKPCLEHDARYIRTTMANAGAHDLKSFRKLAVLERASQRTLRDMLPHDIDVSKE